MAKIFLEQEQNEIILEIKKQNVSKQEIIDELKNLQPGSPQEITINYKSYKRDNKTIAQIKVLRDFKCQICSTTIRKKDGTFYIEAAHIKAKNQKGLETPENIILLCPNHHKEFDFGELHILSHDVNHIEFILNGENHFLFLSVDMP